MTTSEDFYNDIKEMPIKIWQKVLETNDLKYLFKKGKGRVTNKMHDLWLDLQQQYYNEFGVDVEFEIRMKKMKKLAMLRLEYITTGNRGVLTKMSMLEVELKVWGEEQAIKFYDLVDRVQAVRGFQIDLDKMTVVQWYYLLKNISKHNKANVSN